MSVLLDSCNTMRGNKAKDLLDIDGDTVHHAYNADKAFSLPFDHFLEGLFNAINTDFHWSEDFVKL